jgi:polyhydroxybutyrate depolymerase
MRFVAGALLLVLWSGAALGQLANGDYRAVVPPGWDGRAPLKLLIFIHGWQSSASATLADADVTGPAGRAGYLLVAPDGLGKSWSLRSSPAGGRDDVHFVHDVLDDVRKRWPIDPRHVVAAGFSVGASLVWDIACHDAAGFTAFLPLSGGFWVPLPESCATPVNLRQTHGRSDTTFPLTGRTIGQRMRQGNVRDGFARWRAADGCAAPPDGQTSDGDLVCDVWRSCGSGRSLQLCLHPGGHMIEAHHLAAGLAWADALP